MQKRCQQQQRQQQQHENFFAARQPQPRGATVLLFLAQTAIVRYIWLEFIAAVTWASISYCEYVQVCVYVCINFESRKLSHRDTLCSPPH